ncbi:MAG: site-specific integrase [Chloroflexi bacterium]|nr:site-specific integrase [Chloroflexota bacterium]
MSIRAHGEGSITQRKDGRWQGALQVEGIRKTAYGKTRSEVAQKLRKLGEQARRGGGFPASSRLTLGDYLDDWFNQAKPRLRPSTADRYDCVIRLHIVPALGKVHLAKLTSLRLATTYAVLHKTTGKRTVQICHRVLHKALSDAAKWGMVANNVAELVDTPKAEPKTPSLWTQEQITGFLKAMLNGEGKNHGYLLGFLLASGCRMGEAFGLCNQDVNWETGAIRIERQITYVHNKPVESKPKTAAGVRSITLPLWGMEALRRQKGRVAAWKLKAGANWKGGERIFVTEAGTTPTPSNVRRGLWWLCGHLGLPTIRIHDLRHISLSLLAMSGVPVKVAQQRAGHSTAAVTLNIYQHVLGDGDRLAVEALEGVLKGGSAMSV